MTNIVRGARYCSEFQNGSALEPLRFNIFKSSGLWFCNYADESTSYCVGKGTEFVVRN